MQTGLSGWPNATVSRDLAGAMLGHSKGLIAQDPVLTRSVSPHVHPVPCKPK